MSEPKERGDVIQALNELEEATRLGLSEGIKMAHKRLDALGVSAKRRVAVARSIAAEESEEEEPLKAPPVQRSATPPKAKAAPVVKDDQDD